MKSDYTPLGKYILHLTQMRHFPSLRAASLAAGLDGQTISAILRRGNKNKPKPETLEKLARALGGDYAMMMELADHPLPAVITAEPPKLRLLVERLHELEGLSPEAYNHVVDAILLWIEATRIVENATEHPLVVEEADAVPESGVDDPHNGRGRP